MSEIVVGCGGRLRPGRSRLWVTRDRHPFPPGPVTAVSAGGGHCGMTGVRFRVTAAGVRITGATGRGVLYPPADVFLSREAAEAAFRGRLRRAVAESARVAALLATGCYGDGKKFSM